MHGGEFLPAGLMQDGDEIDDMVGALHGAVDRPAHAHIGLHRLDLADIAERLQMAGKVGPPAGDPDAVAALGQRAHDMAADKARPAKDDNKLWGLQDFGHGWLRRTFQMAWLKPFHSRFCAKGKG
ncbi:hypothetical protein MesoLj113b_03220 [Mesorhizobium sp. 113-3-3]|nr:hypothetical protein MesoLj113b_03220 [Mesorhizobium sp. 113-3-3]